jgi:hypothetical protein
VTAPILLTIAAHATAVGAHRRYIAVEWAVTECNEPGHSMAVGVGGLQVIAQPGVLCLNGCVDGTIKVGLGVVANEVNETDIDGPPKAL